eukprot:2650845-Pyramimonas_sp.AAC.1
MAPKGKGGRGHQKNAADRLGNCRFDHPTAPSKPQPGDPQQILPSFLRGESRSKETGARTQERGSRAREQHATHAPPPTHVNRRRHTPPRRTRTPLRQRNDGRYIHCLNDAL